MSRPFVGRFDRELARSNTIARPTPKPVGGRWPTPRYQTILAREDPAPAPDLDDRGEGSGTWRTPRGLHVQNSLGGPTPEPDGADPFDGTAHPDELGDGPDIAFRR